MTAEISDYGPFAPLVGYASAIFATGSAIFFLWAGRTKKLRPPDEALPGMALKYVLLLCGIGMVVQWFMAAPNAILGMVIETAVLASIAFVCFLIYSALLRSHIYTKETDNGNGSSVRVPILGGLKLLPKAEKQLKNRQIDIQTLFEGAMYKEDLLWSRGSRAIVQTLVLLFFVLMLVFGTSSLTGAGFITQVLLTKKAAASVIRSDNAPGLSK